MSSDLITAKPSGVRKVPRITGPVKHPSSHRPFSVPSPGLTFEDRALQPDHSPVSILAQRHLMRGALIRHGNLSFDLGPACLLALRVRITNGLHRPYPAFYIFRG